MNDIGAVVVTYNRKQLLVECIEALLGQACDRLTIYVIDNASTDGTREYIEEYIRDNRIKYYNTGSNIGGAGGFNYGIKKALEMGAEYIWLMDDDTIPDKNCLSELLKADEVLEGQYGFLSSYVSFTDGTTCLMNRQDAARLDWIESRDYMKSGMMRIERATFVSLFLRAKVVKEIGLPIKEFFIWGDDTEYTYRISQKHACYFVSDSTVVHKQKENKNTTEDVFIYDNSDRLDRYYYRFRNLMYIMRKRGKKEYLKHFLGNIIRVFVVLAKGKPYKMRKAGLVLKGTIDGMAFNPRIEYWN